MASPAPVKAFDLYAPAILQGAISGNPGIITASAGAQGAFLDGVQNLLQQVLDRRDQLSQTTADLPPTT
jgi:hypothetical protein